MVGPVGTAWVASISAFLSPGSILTKRACPSLTQLMTSPILALAWEAESLLPLAVARSKTQISTPSPPVWVKAILDWSGDQLKLASLGRSGSPSTDLASAFPVFLPLPRALTERAL